MNDSNERQSNSEKMMTWLLSGLGVALVGVGIVGYFMQGDTPPAGAPVASRVLDAKAKAPAVFSSPVLVITVPKLRGDLLAETRKNPALAPNFAKLVKQSVYFENAQAASSSSLSGTVSAMTGTFPSLHQIYWLPWFSLNGKRPPEEKATTLANNVQPISAMLPHYRSSAWVQDYWVYRTSITNGWARFVRITGQPNFTVVDQFSERTPQLVSNFVDYAKMAKEPRQLYWFHFDDIEYPVIKPNMVKPYLTKPAKTPTPQQLTSHKFVTEALSKTGAKGADGIVANALYWGSVAYWDTNLGLLIEGLKKAGAYDGMTILLTGTSGFSLGENAMSPSAVRVPMLMKMKGQQNAGQTVDESISTASIAPTVMELGGYELSSQFQSRSIVPLVQKGFRKPVAVVTELLQPGVRRFVAQDNSAAVTCSQNINDRTPHPACDLFDLKSDPRMLKPTTWHTANAEQKRKMIFIKDKALSVLKTSPNPFAVASAAR
jgi:arylsulfatase A-like enzyme